MLSGILEVLQFGSYRPGLKRLYSYLDSFASAQVASRLGFLDHGAQVCNKSWVVLRGVLQSTEKAEKQKKTPYSSFRVWSGVRK